MAMDIPQENKDAIRRFDDEIIARGLTHSTRIHYLRMLESFCPQCSKPFSEVTKDDVVSYLSYLSQYKTKVYHKKMSPASIRHYKTALKYFFVWINGHEGVPHCVKFIKRERREEMRKLPKDMLSTEEIRKMIEAAPNPRDKAMVAILYESACRAGELLDMKVGDIKLDKYGAVASVSGKTGDRRIRLIDSVPDLQVWLNCHPLRDNPNAPLWTAVGLRVKRENEINGANRLIYHAKPLYIKGLQHRLWKIAKWAGIQKRVHPHLFRHSRLTELAKKGFREAELKIFAGWTELSKSPATYIHLSGADVDRKLLEAAGVLEEEALQPDENLKPTKCPRCLQKNPIGAKFCYQCSLALDFKEAQLADLERKVEERATKKTLELGLQRMIEEMFEKRMKELALAKNQ